MHHEYDRPLGRLSPERFRRMQQTSIVSHNGRLIGGPSEKVADLGIVPICGYSGVGKVFGKKVFGPEA